MNSNVVAFNNGNNYCDPISLSLEHHRGCDCQHTAFNSTQTFYCLMYSVSHQSKNFRVKRPKNQDVPCSFICLICFTVSFRIAHLSGLTLKLSMSLKLAKISSASSSMYLFSCSRLRFSLLRLGLKKKKHWIDCGCYQKQQKCILGRLPQQPNKKGKKGLAKVFQNEDGSIPDFREMKKKSYLGPKSSDEQSLRFRDSALAGSDGVSPTPLIIKAYQCLKHRNILQLNANIGHVP